MIDKIFKIISFIVKIIKQQQIIYKQQKSISNISEFVDDLGITAQTKKYLKETLIYGMKY